MLGTTINEQQSSITFEGCELLDYVESTIEYSEIHNVNHMNIVLNSLEVFWNMS